MLGVYSPVFILQKCIFYLLPWMVMHSCNFYFHIQVSFISNCFSCIQKMYAIRENGCFELLQNHLGCFELQLKGFLPKVFFSYILILTKFILFTFIILIDHVSIWLLIFVISIDTISSQYCHFGKHYKESIMSIRQTL